VPLKVTKFLKSVPLPLETVEKAGKPKPRVGKRRVKKSVEVEEQEIPNNGIEIDV